MDICTYIQADGWTNREVDRYTQITKRKKNSSKSPRQTNRQVDKWMERQVEG